MFAIILKVIGYTIGGLAITGILIQDYQTNHADQSIKNGCHFLIVYDRFTGTIYKSDTLLCYNYCPVLNRLE